MANMNKTCATCRHWDGDDSDYQGLCMQPDNARSRPVFDSTCGLWAIRPALVAETPAPAVFDQWTAYKQLVSKGRNTP